MTGRNNLSKRAGTGLTFPVYIPDSSLIQLPFRRDSFPSSTITPADVARHDRIVTLVEQMLDLNKRLAAAKAPHEKEVLAGMIGTTDRQIGRLVYELYGLTEDEVAVVEGAA
ncbi:MAG: hypothetical protein XD82_0160 [Methanoculleus marisnigri]|jgi:hypothetical protein|uniref:Uncharacterized protein n=1 Tax=Methanoculleus marisnigri TaxID=2198 RepID=A0A101GS78_9EURY|nr:MAG: hypothetical protein XD82_0160 [Methanoculleus marisnigri]